MPGRVIQRPAAKRDLIECFAHIGVDNEPAALRFLQAANETFHELAEMPGYSETPSAAHSADGASRASPIF
jgi:plasmid stabilization system protein ParE